MSQEALAQARARNIRDALEEDIGPCDWTAQLISPKTRAEATLRVREAAVLCGQEWFSGCIARLDPSASIRWRYPEGALMPANSDVCEIAANARALLTAERPAMNFLQLLSATATQTRAFADAIAGMSPNPRGCVVLDTRKTVPGLRQAQKYAVRVGGGANQRLALWDGILIKENHILAAGGIAAALQAARALNAAVSIAGAESILIDNFSLQDMRDAVAINQGRALLEASGGISLESIRAVAATGVDRISVGSITKDVKAIDFSLRVTARHDQPAG
jgi:nicotinate-nucleotide pyrophosphorylase (carboxylating)